MSITKVPHSFTFGDTRLHIELQPTHLRRYDCFFCDRQTDKAAEQAMVVMDDGLPTFKAVCRRCRTLSAAELRQMVLDRAVYQTAFASDLMTLAMNLPSLPPIPDDERTDDDEGLF